MSGALGSVGAGQGLGGQRWAVPIPPWVSTPALQNICVAKCSRARGEAWATEGRAHLVKEAPLLPVFLVSSWDTVCPGCQDRGEGLGDTCAHRLGWECACPSSLPRAPSSLAQPHGAAGLPFLLQAAELAIRGLDHQGSGQGKAHQAGGLLPTPCPSPAAPYKLSLPPMGSMSLQQPQDFQLGAAAVSPASPQVAPALSALVVVDAALAESLQLLFWG